MDSQAYILSYLFLVILPHLNFFHLDTLIYDSVTYLIYY